MYKHNNKNTEDVVLQYVKHTNPLSIQISKKWINIQEASG